MSDWKPVKLSDICILEKGQQIDTSLLDDSKPYRYINGGIKESGYFDNFNTSGESVLISEGGASCGYINYVNEDFWCGCHCYRLHDIKVFPKYLFHALKANQQRIMALRTGSAMPNIQKSTIQKFELKIHDDINTQKKVSSMLDKCNELIDKHKLTLEKYDSLIKSRFIEMFGDPVKNPMGWDVIRFGDLIESIRYGTSTPPIFSETGFAFIRATNIKNGKIINQDMKFISEEEALKIQKCKLNGNELLIVRSGVNSGDTCVVTKEYINQYAGYDMIIVLGDKLNPIYINELLNTNYMEKVIKPLTRRAAQPHLNSEQTQGLPIILPPMSLQEQFSSFVQQIDKSKFEYTYIGVAA